MANVVRAVYLFLALTLGFQASPAFAGFEWLPPAQVQVPPAQKAPAIPVPFSPPQQAAMSASAYDDGGMMPLPAPAVGAPMPIVESEMAVVPMVEQQMLDNYVDTTPARTITPEMMPAMTANTPAGLVINPYPTQGGFTQAENNPKAHEPSIEQAMMAHAGLINPMPLNRVENTAARPARGPVPGAVQLGSAPANQQMMMARASSGAMTPLPGGEPAPLQIPGVTTMGGMTSYPEAIGFGRDLPLAMALTQVVPEGFAYSFGEDVDPGVNVSWEGGRPWNEVLQEMLAPSGLSAMIDQNRVIVYSGSSAT